MSALQDNFDKFSLRNCTDRILMELWKDPGGNIWLLVVARSLLVVWRVAGSTPFQAQQLHLRSLATVVIGSPKHGAAVASA